uniref:Uncharacterized protein n=1 Tax=Physcomitrium patens TaxID=3218 RepID=A0A2K1JD16_PHYPA|nr:hypothetical protein PHYPA_019703 [Physcomitrium patens]
MHLSSEKLDASSNREMMFRQLPWDQMKTKLHSFNPQRFLASRFT